MRRISNDKDHPRLLPYTIAGTIIIYRWSLKWFNFDWKPAQEPYDIPYFLIPTLNN